MTQGVAHRPAPVTRRVAHRPAPVTQRVAHRPAPVTQRVAHKGPPMTHAPVTQRVAQQALPWHKALRRPAPVTRRVAHRPAPVTQRVAHKPPHDTRRCAQDTAMTQRVAPAPVTQRRWQAAPLLRRRILAMVPETTWMRRCPCKPCQISSDLYRSSNPPRTRWHNALRTDPPPWHNALRTRPPMTQGVAHKTLPWHNALRPPLWHKGADRPPPSSGGAFWQWSLRPLGWGVVHASLVRSPPNYTEAQIHPGPVDTTRRAQTRPHDTTRCAQGPPHDTRPRDTTRCATGSAMTQGVAQTRPRDTTRCAQARPRDTTRCAQAPPWHKALRTRHCHDTTRCARPCDTKALTGRPPPQAAHFGNETTWMRRCPCKPCQISSDLYRSSNPPRTRWHNALRTGPPPWHNALRTSPPMTQGVAHKTLPWHNALRPPLWHKGADRPPPSSGGAFWQWSLRPLGWGVVLASLIRSPPNYTEAQIHPGPVDTTRRAQTRPHDTTRCAQGPPVIQRVAQQAVPWHKALRTCRPAPVTQRVAHKAPPRDHDTRCCARPCDTRRWQAAGLLRRRILAMDPEATWMRRCPCKPYEIFSEIDRGSNPPRTPVTQRVAHRPAPMTQHVAHKAPPWHNALRNRPCHDTRRCAQTRPRNTTRCAQARPRDTTRCAQARPRDTTRCAQGPPHDTRPRDTTRCATGSAMTQGVAQTRPRDTTRCAQARPRDTTRCAQAPPWHKALRTRHCHDTTRCARPCDTKALTGRPPPQAAHFGNGPWDHLDEALSLQALSDLLRSIQKLKSTQDPVTQRVAHRPAPMTQRVAHKAPPWHNALCADPPPWHNALRTRPPHDTRRCAQDPPMTQRVVPAPVTQGADRPPPSSAHDWQVRSPLPEPLSHRHTPCCAQGPPGWHKALCAGPSPNKALCTRPNALRTRCQKSNQGPAPPHTPEC